MSHRCEEQDPRRETARWIHPEDLPDEPFFLIPELCHCNYEMKYEVVKVEDYMKERLAYYHRAVEREARLRRRIWQEIDDANNADAAEQAENEGDNEGAAEQPQNQGNNAEAAEQPRNERLNAEAAEQPQNEGINAEAAEQPRNARINVEAAEQPRNARINAEAAEQPRNERINAEAAEQPQYPRIDIRVAQRLRNDRMNARAAERLRYDGMNVRAAGLRAERRRDDENLPNPEENPRPPGILAAVLAAAGQRNNPAIQNPGQAAQRPIPGLQPLANATNSQDEFDGER